MALRRDGKTMSVHVISWALRHSEATLGDRLVMLVLADHAKDDGTNAWPSVATIATQARLSERQTQRALRNLEELGEIVATGRSQKGTTVYSIVGYRVHEGIEGGDNMAPRQGVGGDMDGTGGVTSTTPGGDVGVTRSVLDPPLNRQDPSVGSPSRGTVVALHGSRPEKPGWKVAGRPVAEAEGGLARAVLELWNDRTGQRLTAKEWVAKIVMRVREHPELDLDAHELVIEAALRQPWWSGPASPSVVYLSLIHI